ncbi:hypothetical protein CVT25_002613 [Psilocybe cyanescens]|uniref:Uncharacterized protein n=1 Tax=Psilocybe cyanescens TaxID=93625 RepID=A0A409WLW3_PSICY|nr:hypothetical protein CVT25_002613 [Psilocybe cyanescens]
MLPEFKVVFPAPPPTTNELTAQQRTHLVRKTRKIEQLLGTTPRLLDTSVRPASPIHVSFPYALPQRRLTKTRRSSIDSTSSASSSGSSSSPVQRSSSLSLSSSNSNLRPINSRARSKHLSSSDSDGGLLSESWSWTYDNTAPLLRLAMESMTLETIPASPSPTRDSFADIAPPSLSSVSEEEPASRIFAPSAQSADTPSPRNSFVLASPPSSNSLRKQKMDRLRKKLGSDVPFDLVFPKESNRAHSENTPPSFRDKECPSLPLPVPTPRAARRSTGRIASSRDSISDSVSIHRARRQAHSPSALDKRAPLTAHHKKSRSEPQRPPVLPPLDFKRSLSFIIESPEEHGSGCTEEFGLSRTSSSKSDSNLTSGWIVQSYAQDAEFKIWSTRRGYEGWSANNNSSSKVNLSPISTIYFPSSNDDSSSPTSSASSSPHSPTASGTERKRRPSSYRKPPPALPVELC